MSVLSRAGPSEVAFLADTRHAAQLESSAAGACFLAHGCADHAPAGCAKLTTSVPQAAWAVAAGRLHRPKLHGTGAESIDPTAAIEDEVEIAAGVVVGAGAMIGRGTTLGPGAVIGPGVAIGRDCCIGANATVGFALIGDGVRVYAGAVIGEAGFGATAGPEGLIDIPQLGRVIIQDGVTIGAGTCIDRGAFEDTTIGENTKIDNLVQIAHNVVVGRNCVLVAHTGISGSVVIGDGCQLGGRVGTIDHVTIGAGARLAAGAGLMESMPAGETWGGFPARPLKRWLREVAWVSRQAGRPRGSGS